MRVVTSGARYIDIDAYAGCVAYAELLQKLGQPAQAVGEAVLNESIPSIVREWQTDFKTAYVPSGSDTFTLIDVSEPEYFETFVDHDRIDEIIDHHPGLEQYWHDRIGGRAAIEHVGAACTQVFERWEQAAVLGRMSETSARLLMCGILDNTLNFGAEITTGRDENAYEALGKIAGLPKDWPAKYFAACQAGIVYDLLQAVERDVKTMCRLKTFPGPLAVGQLAVWEGSELALNSSDTFRRALSADRPLWLMNLISIEDGRSYFVTEVPAVRAWLTNLLGVRFDGNVAVADRMWLRKEILKVDIVVGGVQGRVGPPQAHQTRMIEPLHPFSLE